MESAWPAAPPDERVDNSKAGKPGLSERAAMLHSHVSLVTILRVWRLLCFALSNPAGLSAISRALDSADQARHTLVYLRGRTVSSEASASPPLRVPRARVGLPPPSKPFRFGIHGLVLAVILLAVVVPADWYRTVKPVAVPSQHVYAAHYQPGDEVIVRAVPLTETVPQELAFPQHTRITDQEIGVFTRYHALAEGDTLASLAHQYGVSVASIFWSNDLDSGTLLQIGRELRIPRLSGVPYVIQPDDTLERIAAEFGVPVDALLLLRENHLDSGKELVTGQEIFVPGAVRAYPDPLLQQLGGEEAIGRMQALVAGAIHENDTNMRSGPGRDYDRIAYLDAGTSLEPLARHADWIKVSSLQFGPGWVRSDMLALSEQAIAALPETSDFPPPPPRWIWPTYGQMTSSFGWRREPYRSFHNGLDIANRAGTPIVAARSGVVFEAGWCSGFGYCVKIDHGGGVSTIYGHMLRKPFVVAGEKVEAGDRIGLMGSTFDRAGGGYSTGVHLHFTVKVNGQVVDPLKYLP